MNTAVLTALYRGHASQLRTKVRDQVIDRFEKLTGFDDASAEEFVDRAVLTVTAGQRAAVRQTAAYLRLVAIAETGESRSVPDLLKAAPGARIISHLTDPVMHTSTPLQKVYMRPFFQLWRDLHDGAVLPDAFGTARKLLARTVGDDIALASRFASHVIIAHDDRVVGWERMSSLVGCQKCTDGSKRMYHRDDVMPLHYNDACFVRPVYHAGDRIVERAESILNPDFGPTFKEPQHA